MTKSFMVATKPKQNQKKTLILHVKKIIILAVLILCFCSSVTRIFVQCCRLCKVRIITLVLPLLEYPNWYGSVFPVLVLSDSVALACLVVQWSFRIGENHCLFSGLLVKPENWKNKNICNFTSHFLVGLVCTIGKKC